MVKQSMVAHAKGEGMTKEMLSSRKEMLEPEMLEGPCEEWLSQGAWGVYLVFQFQLLLALGLSPGGLVR